jgi:hypothetical protein
MYAPGKSFSLFYEGEDIFLIGNPDPGDHIAISAECRFDIIIGGGLDK